MSPFVAVCVMVVIVAFALAALVAIAYAAGWWVGLIVRAFDAGWS
jgi:hypothetical protein